jgi:hypothetical protein
MANSPAVVGWRDNSASRLKRGFTSIIAKLVVIAVITLNGFWVWALGWGVWKGLRAIVGAL